MTNRGRVALFGFLAVLIGALLVALLAIAASSASRPLVIALGVGTEILLVVLLVANSVTYLPITVAAFGTIAAFTALRGGIILTAAIDVTIFTLCLGELAALMGVFVRVEPSVAIDWRERARDSATMIAIGAVAAVIAALASLIHLPGGIVLVMLAALAAGIIGRLIAVRAQA